MIHLKSTTEREKKYQKAGHCEAELCFPLNDKMLCFEKPKPQIKYQLKRTHRNVLKRKY